MKKFFAFGLAATMALSGCLVSYRDYRSDRDDLKISGNKGCLKGKCEKHETTPAYDLPNKRLTNVFEVELGSHKDRAVAPKPAETNTADEEMVAPVKSRSAAVAEPVADPDDAAYASDLKAAKTVTKAKNDVPAAVATEAEAVAKTACEGDIAEHVVAAGETLQKISMKYYGTTKNYPAIFEANRDKLKTLNSVRAGQKLKIPCK